MTPRSLRKTGRRLTAAFLSAALVLSGSGPVYAQEIRAVSGRVETIPAGEAGSLALPNVLAPLDGGVVGAGLRGSLGSVTPAPSIVDVSGALGGHAKTMPLRAEPSLVPVALAPAAEKTGPLAALKSLVGVSAVRPSALVPGVGAGTKTTSAAKTPAALGGVLRSPSKDQPLSDDATSVEAKEYAAEQFHRLGAGDGATSGQGAVAVEDGAAPARSGRKTWTRRLTLLAAGIGLASMHVGTRAAGAVPPGASALADHPTVSAFSQMLGNLGYWGGNVLAFLFPIPELHKAVKDAKVHAPAWRVGVLVAASLALGLVNAPLGGMYFWGIQNIFGAVVSVAAWPAARWVRATAGPDGVSGRGALATTAVFVGLSLLMAAGLYFTVGALLTAGLTAAVGAAGAANVALGIQAVTGGLYFLLFLPDIISIVRGKAPQGFTPAFSMLFLLASLGFVFWTGNQAWLAAPGSAQRAQFGLYAALNAAYVLVAGASWYIARRADRKEAAAKATVVAPEQEKGENKAEDENAETRGPTKRFAKLAEAESRAHSAARARAGNVRLLRVSVDLTKKGPRWVFAFHAPAKKQILTYGPDGVEAKKTGDGRPPMLHPEQISSIDLDELLAALKVSDPGFAPVRAEIVPTKDGFKARAYDKAGDSRELVAPVALTKTIAPVTDDQILSEEPVKEPIVTVVPKALKPVDRPDEIPVDESQIVSETPVAETPVVEEPVKDDGDYVQEYGPVQDEFPGLQNPPAADSPAAQSPDDQAAAAEPALPRSWKKLPSEAREMTAESMLAAKAEAQARARTIAPDARLVSVRIDLTDPASHWVFVFRSDKSRRELTVWTKRIKVKKLTPKALKAPTLHGTRLASVGALAAAYAALKKADPRFRPVRVEVDPAWNGPAAFRFLDAFGREAAVGPDGKVVKPSPALPVTAGAVPPASFAALPEDARGADGATLAELKAQAQDRARRLAPDARLVKIALDLTNEKAHWVFVFRSDSRREELTVWTKRVKVRNLRPGERRVPTLADSRLRKVASVASAYAALKAAKPGLKPQRLELTPTWKGDASWSFQDARGRGTAVAGVALEPVPDKEPDLPPSTGPPETKSPPESQTGAEGAATKPEPPKDEPPKQEPPKKDEEPSGPKKYVYENFLGWRHVQGERRDPTLKPLTNAATADEVIDHISRQFGIPKERVLELGRNYQLSPISPVSAWLGVYDRLQDANREQFKRLDHKKYSGFRDLANISYAPGWKGRFQRALEVHKHFLGAAVRFPYHLFDMFIFGYFRQAISFEARHSTEDFLSTTGRYKFAEQWLEASMRKYAFKGEGAFSGVRASSWFRNAQRYFLRPVVSPLTTFILRRLTLAIMSAIAMGLLGAFAPVLPLSFSLTAIPYLGPAIVTALNGFPVLVAAVPFVGDFLAPVVAAATHALAKDLVLGPLLNTLILSTLLTLPHTVRERVARVRDDQPLAKNLPVKDVAKAVLGAVVAWEFWKANLKTFFGLATVGAEIEGIMTYAGGIDAAINPGFKAVTGREFHAFHAIGAAVERPAGDSPIPFGGAITWGNTLLYKVQGLLGFNISDAVMRTVLVGKSVAMGDSVSDITASKLSAQQLVAASSQRGSEGALPFDPDLYKLPMDQVAARIKELAGKAGAIDAEIKAVSEHKTKLLSELGDEKAQLARLRALSNPVTEAEKAELARLVADLAKKSDEVGARDKLSERRDLLSGPSDADALARLQALQKQYESMLPPPPPDKNGYWEDLATRDASYKALSTRLKDYAEGRVARVDGTPAPTLDPKTKAAIETLVGEIEALRTEAQGEMAQRNATSQLLQAANSTRNRALRERRDGKDMLRFHTDMAKLASVMDLALALNEINAAQAAIKQMMDLLDAKRAKIAKSRENNVSNQAGADANSAQVAQWKKDAQKTIDDDDQMLKDLSESEQEAGLVATTLGGFQTDVRGFIDAVNAADKGQSADAATEYQRRIDLLPQIKEWRTNGGNPNDPDAFSLKKLNESLAEVNDNIQKAQDGLARLPTVPVEFAGVLVIEIPGPAVTIHNPTKEQTLQILSDRKVYWQGKKTDFQKSLSSVERMMDAGNSATVVDEFGDAHPESLPRWKAQSQSEVTASQEATRRYLAVLDANAAEINRFAGSNIPMLSGLSLKELQDAIKTYGDSLKAVKFPDNGTDALARHQAMMKLVVSAKTVPIAAREVIKWSKADATVTAIDDAMANTLPQARAGLQGVVAMLDDVLADVDADVAFVNTGVGGGQVLIDRKTSLLRDKIIPPLQGARTMLTQTLIPYQQKSIDGVTGPNSDFFKLYDAKKTLITQTVKLYDHTIPWAFATFGAADGDQAAAAQGIADWQHKLQKNLDGYDDAKGHHKGIHEYQVEMQNRKDPNFTGTEVIYGETQPFSLPKKIAQYTDERATRASQINAQDAQINEILDRIQTISHGKYDLSAFKLPVGVTPDAAGVARVQAAVDGRAIQNLVDKLKAVADEQSAAGGIDIGGGNGDGTTPTGVQPPITISESQQISLLSLDAAKRLVPSSLSQPDTAPAAYGIARFLYSDSVIKAATDGLNVQVPAAERFLGDVSRVLGDAIADIPHDTAYAQSNGTSETPESVYARKVRVFSQIDAVLTQGMDFFHLKKSWDQDSFGSIDKVQSYYSSLHDIYNGGQTANDNEVVALDKMSDALKKTMEELEAKRQKVSSWLNQLNPKEKSALNNVSEDVSKIMDRTRAVLEANIDWHDLEDQLSRSKEILQAQFTQIDDKQAELAQLLANPDVQGQLPADLVRRIESLRMGRGGWSTGGNDASIVIRKSQYGAFVDTLIGMLGANAQASAQNLAAIKADLLKNPQSIANLIPDSKVLDFGDTADGFYLVYQSRFSVPHGLETGSWVTLGNVGRVFGSNVSISGYQFASPPSKDGENAPYGDKGLEVQVESLQGKNWVNYLNVDLHRFAFDIPKDYTVAAGAGESRMMIFDDFAVMMFGDRLYVGLAGFADGAVSGTMDKPYYYGGNLKTSLKLTEVMKLNAEQRVMFAKDPRSFLQDVNLDFTGYDPDLNHTYSIFAKGENKSYSRTQIGPQFDLNRLMNPDGGGDTFTLDLYYAKTSGTDDVNQSVGGVSILKGFSLKRDDGRTWMRIDDRLTGEVGQKMNEIGDKLSVSFPDQGLVVSAEGRIIGGASTYYGEISKRMSDHGSISLGYGSQYVGMNNRLSISMNTSFTLAELWQAVTDKSAENLKGGETLKAYNAQLSDFFSRNGDSRTAVDLQRVFEQDVARKLVTQDIGELTREIQELRKAGAFMDNSRMRGMVGFVSGPVSNDVAERAVGGGFAVGSFTEMSLSRTQKQLIESKAQILYREGLRLQDRMLQLTKDWQASVVEIAEAQWELKLANFAAQNAPNEAARRDAQVKVGDAEARLHQAVLKYNALTGRDPNAAPPFQDLSSDDLQRMLGNIRRLITAPDRLSTILGSLDEESLKKSVGDNPFNLVDWIPWVDKLTVGFGVQYQDMMANQALTVGASVRLPIYDPASKSADKAYALETEAVKAEMAGAYRERTISAQAALEQAKIWQAAANDVAGSGGPAADRLSDAIRQYRNGLIGSDALNKAFDDWHFYMSTTLESMARSALLQAQGGVDLPFARPNRNASAGTVRLTSIEQAFGLASNSSMSLAEIAKRQQAAEEMARSADHRINKAWLDINVGVGLTAQGVGWLPSIGITGIPVTPVLGFELKPEEMRELQVTQHDQQAEYYKALKTKVEAGLAVQFYQSMVSLRSAKARLDVYDNRLIPQLEGQAAGDMPGAQRKLDEAKLGREQALLEYSRSRSTINLLLGRDANAPVTVEMDERSALEGLSRLLAAKDPVGTNMRILDSRVATAKAVEEMVDKNMKVELLQLEPVSLVVRSLGRLMGAFSDGAISNPELAAAARIQTLNEERERDAYGARRDADASKLRLQLNAAKDRLNAIRNDASPEAMLEKSRLATTMFTLQSGLLALGVNPDDDAPSGRNDLPRSWADLTRRLADSEQSLTTVAPESKVDLLDPGTLQHRSNAFVRFYYAKQTLGHEPLDQFFTEGWIELRLKDPGTPPEVLIRLAELRTAKADRIYKDALVGAAARADILAAQFEGDVRLLRYVDRQIRTRSGSDTPSDLDGVRKALTERLEGQRGQIVARLGLPSGTTLESLMALVPEDASPASDLQSLSADLIKSIRDRQIDAVRRTLFEGGTPASWGSEDNIMGQIKANTIAERMSYKGFTPVATFGWFRGRTIGGAFLEAPDPRAIENGLEKIMGDVLRKQMQSDGRLQELTLRLHSLMVKVEDGSKGLEARRKLIEAAESELRARAQTDGKGSPEYLAAEANLVKAWDDFAVAMTQTKADFITLVTELEALGEGNTGTLRPFTTPDRPEVRVPRSDTRTQLLDYWADRYGDPAFEASADALLSQMGNAVPADVRGRIARAAAEYRTALRDRDAVLSNDFSEADRLATLTKIDVEGHRLMVRAALEDALRGVGLLDPNSNPLAKTFLEFMRRDIDAASDAFSIDRQKKVALSRELDQTYWRAYKPADGEAATLQRLADLNKDLEEARDVLLTSYLADTGEDAKRFVLKDLHLDAYLKAQDAFDRELTRTLEGKPGVAMMGAISGLYDVRKSLDRQIERAAHGRGMAALDALIMLEENRLRAARWTHQTPARIDPIAEALSELKELRAKWADKKADDLEPLYAVTIVSGPKGETRTWDVRQWLTGDEFKRLLDAGKADPNGKGVILERNGRYFIDVPGDGSTLKYEVIGGGDAADAIREKAAKGFSDNAADAALFDKMKTSDFVALGGAGEPPLGWTFKEFFGAGGLHAKGRVFFFEAQADKSKTARALHPLAALSRPPDGVVMLVYTGDQPLRRDAFPTLQSLEASGEAAKFKKVLMSPTGAAELQRNAARLEAAERRRGWVEVKLNSYGFARDEKGNLAQLYRTKDDFEAQWKAFDNASRDLASAKADKATADAERAARKDEMDAAKADNDRQSLLYGAAQAQLREALRAAMISEGVDPQSGGFTAELDRRVAEPKFSKLPKIKDRALSDAVEKLHAAYAAEREQMDRVAKTLTEAIAKFKLADARAVNAKKAVADAEATLAHSGTWTLTRSSDLTLRLDERGAVVSVAAKGARGPADTRDFDMPVMKDDAKSVARTISGPLFAAVVDEDGFLKNVYTSDDAVDAAFAGWTMKSYKGGGDVVGSDADESLTKVRFSHYEENGLPVLLGEGYLIDRLEGAQSALWKAKHWSILPYNWGNILLEIPRGVAGIPAEFFGRDQNQQHYLGRAYMYKTEGGATQHHGFFRKAVGFVDILNLLPDPADRFFDPSEFPDVVRIDSPVRPGDGLWDKRMRSGDLDIHLGQQYLQRETNHAAEDLEAARVRTLSRFQGGVETLTLETRRGRNGFYQESTLKADLGDKSVADRLRDPLIDADPNSDGSGDVVTSATPGALFVDKVERRVRIRPGADYYGRQTKAYDGYSDVVGAKVQKNADDRAGLEATLKDAEGKLAVALQDRDRARSEQEDLRRRWTKLSQRIGTQLELERRMKEIEDRIKVLDGRVSFWNRYLKLLDEARVGRPSDPNNPGDPTDPTDPNHPKPPYNGNAMFWVWMMVMGFLASLASAAWNWLRRRRDPSAPPSFS